ncbi:MAG: DUF3556 domain-containing protein [Mycobacterium sp.]
MGFLRPDLPEIDVGKWGQASSGGRIRPMARHIAERGLGTPLAVHCWQVVRIGLFIAGGVGFAMTTTGIGGAGGISRWWREPIVFEKLVLWAVLFGVLGLGSGFGSLHRRFFPPICCAGYWLRPGTIKLPPWPNRVPFTGGDTRTPIDTVLVWLLVVMTVIALLSDGTGPDAGLGSAVGVIPAWKTAAVISLLIVIGLRDKVVFVAAGGAVYGTLMVAFLFPATDAIVAAKLVMVVMWVGAAASKLNRHFPFVLAVMMSNSPAIRARWTKRSFYEHFPNDLRPASWFRSAAYVAAFVEFVAPLVLLLSPEVVPSLGQLPIVAAWVLVTFHALIVLSMPIGVPLEWNVVMVFGIFILFIDKAGIGLGDMRYPAGVAILVSVVVAATVLGNVFPQAIWFLPPAMRYYAGNGDSALCCLTQSARDKIDDNVPMWLSMPQAHFEKCYDKEQAAMLAHIGYAFRAMNTHGRALFALVGRMIPADRTAQYTIVDGESVCSAVLGWNFGDGHLPSEQLIAALQRRCHFEPGEALIAILDAQPIHRQTQQYRLVDAATGEFERGVIEVAELVVRQPWADDVPVHVRDPK